MKKLILIILLIASINSLYGQVGNEKITQTDSIALIKTWNRFKKQLYREDIRALKLLSCKKVSGHCIFESINTNCQPYSSPNKLLGLFFRQMFPGNRKIILSDKYFVAVYNSEKDKMMKIKYPKQFQIWFTNKSEPGYQFAFLFGKVKGKFKFSGIDSVP